MPELQNNNNELFLNPSMDEEEQIPTTKELDANIYNKIDENLRLVIDCYIANAYPGSHTFIHFYRHDDENKKHI